MAILKRCMTTACLLLVVSSVNGAAANGLTDAQVRAGFLYNFSMFVEWPAAVMPNGTLLVGVIGDDAFATTLQMIDGRTANGRKIAVRALDESDDLRRTGILYIGVSDDRLAAALLSRVADAPVLTVGATPRFAQMGGVVRFYTDESKLRFEINVARSQQLDLRISSKLLSLAKIVKAPQ